MDSRASSAANCGFVLHVLVVAVGILYIWGIWLRNVNKESSVDKESLWSGPQLNESSSTWWSVTGSAISVVLFFAAPVVYALLNSLTVVSISSMESLCDSYSRKDASANGEWYDDSYFLLIVIHGVSIASHIRLMFLFIVPTG